MFYAENMINFAIVRVRKYDLTIACKKIVLLALSVVYRRREGTGPFNSRVGCCAGDGTAARTRTETGISAGKYDQTADSAEGRLQPTTGDAQTKVLNTEYDAPPLSLAAQNQTYHRPNF